MVDTDESTASLEPPRVAFKTTRTFNGIYHKLNFKNLEAPTNVRP